MYNPQLPTDGSQASQGASMSPHASDFGQRIERHGNERIRLLLKSFGLRTSLIRLKVIDALHMADKNGRSIGVRGIHSQFEQLDIPLSFLSVREVLKRLCTEGVISMGSDKCYSLNPEARGILAQGCPR